MADGVNIDWSLAQPKQNYADTFANAFALGRQVAGQRIQENALTAYGADPTAPIDPRLMAANPELGLQLQDYQRAAGDRTANIAAATAAAGGDYTGAAKGLAATGNVEGVTSLQQTAVQMTAQQRALALQRAEQVAGVLHGIQMQTSDPNERLAMARHVAATSGFGIDPNSITLDDVTDQGIAGHMASVMTLQQQLDQEDKARTAGETHRHNVAEEGRPQYVETKNADGSTSQVLVNPAAVGAAQGAAPAAAAGPVPRGLRNNNPVNVTVLPPGHSWNGQTGTDGNFAVFGSPQAGWDAADRNLQSYAQLHGINTIAGVVTRWAPPGAHNDPAGYAARVAQAVGVDPNAPLNMSDPAMRQKVLTAMAGVEQGQPVPYGGGAQAQAAPPAAASYQVASTGATPGPPGAAAPAAPAAAPTIGGTPTRIGGDVPAGQAPGDPTKTGDAYLATLDPTTRAEVNAILDGRLGVPKNSALRSPQIARLVAAAATADPSFDEANAGARAKTRADFAAGPSSRQVVSFNTALGHLAQLDQAIDGLHNGSIPFGNNTVNFLKQATGDASIDRYRTAAFAAATEFSKALQGGQPHETEIQEWTKQLSEDKSPAQLHATVAKMADLLASKINALGDQYSQGMGVTRDGITLLHPDAAGTLARLGGQNGAEATARAQFYQRAEAAGMPAREIDGAWQQFAKGKTFGAPAAPGRGPARGGATSFGASTAPSLVRGAGPPPSAQPGVRHYNPATGRLE